MSVGVRAQSKDGAYYCVTEFSGGLAYNETLKRWQSATFRPTYKFVTNFKYIGPHINDSGVAPYSEDYYVTITPSGGDKSEDCLTYFLARSEKIEFTIAGGLGSCETIGARYSFNLKNKRFLRVFENGYVNGGADKDSDTPSIGGGTCTKIQ